MLIVSNHNVPLSPIKTENIKVVVEGLKNCNTVILERIDEYNANPKRKWVEMGSPGYLTKEQIEELIKVSEIKKNKFLVKK